MAQAPINPLAMNKQEFIAASGLPKRVIDQAIKSGEIPHMRCGHQILILLEDGLAYMRKLRDQRRVPTTPPTPEGAARLAALNKKRLKGGRPGRPRKNPAQVPAKASA